jgi:hypothetical protein
VTPGQELVFGHIGQAQAFGDGLRLLVEKRVVQRASDAMRQLLGELEVGLVVVSPRGRDDHGKTAEHLVPDLQRRGDE